MCRWRPFGSLPQPYPWRRAQDRPLLRAWRTHAAATTAISTGPGSTGERCKGNTPWRSRARTPRGAVLPRPGRICPGRRRPSYCRCCWPSCSRVRVPWFSINSISSPPGCATPRATLRCRPAVSAGFVAWPTIEAIPVISRPPDRVLGGPELVKCWSAAMVTLALHPERQSRAT